MEHKIIPQFKGLVSQKTDAKKVHTDVLSQVALCFSVLLNNLLCYNSSTS